MIELFEGRIGSGKTLMAVMRILMHLAQGGTVATNIELHWEECCKFVAKRWGVELEADQLIKLVDAQIYDVHRWTPEGTAESPLLIVIDESALNFDNRDFAQNYKDHRETFTFLRQSRKVFNDLIFIAQDTADVDKKIRGLAEYTWRMRDLSKWKLPGLGIKFPFNWIQVLQLDHDGRTVLDRDFVPKNKALFPCYNTYSLLRKFPRLEGVTIKRNLRKVEKPKPPVFLISALALVDLFLVIANFL